MATIGTEIVHKIKAVITVEEAITQTQIIEAHKTIRTQELEVKIEVVAILITTEIEGQTLQMFNVENVLDTGISQESAQMSNQGVE